MGASEVTLNSMEKDYRMPMRVGFGQTCSIRRMPVFKETPLAETFPFNVFVREKPTEEAGSKVTQRAIEMSLNIRYHLVRKRSSDAGGSQIEQENPLGGAGWTGNFRCGMMNGAFLLVLCFSACSESTESVGFPPP